MVSFSFWVKRWMSNKYFKTNLSALDMAPPGMLRQQRSRISPFCFRTYGRNLEGSKHRVVTFANIKMLLTTATQVYRLGFISLISYFTVFWDHIIVKLRIKHADTTPLTYRDM
jgi:hypothetical protein